MTASVQEILQWLHNNDCGGNDHSAIAKYYERIADHATNIAEWVEYSLTGLYKGDKL